MVLRFIMINKTILSLFDYSGKWSKPYKDAGYDVLQFDLQYGDDVRLIKKFKFPIYGILAAPPCTEFASSGARWWDAKGDEALAQALSLVSHVYRIVEIEKPEFYVIENPIGRLIHYLGEPKLRFDPCEYAGYNKSNTKDWYNKRTCLWGNFNIPVKDWRMPIYGSKMHKQFGGKSLNTKNKRSETPEGFARAFYEANK